MLVDTRTLTECIVGDGDTDVYGHMNNSRYHLYFELGRIKALSEAGILDEELIKSFRGLPVIKKCTEYKRGVRAGEKISIYSTIQRDRLRIIIEHEMYNSGNELVATERTEHALKDLKRDKAMKLTEEIMAKVLEVHSEMH